MVKVFDTKTKELVISDDKSYGYILNYTNGRSILTFEDIYPFTKNNKDDEDNRIYSDKNKEMLIDQSRKYIYYSATDDYQSIKIIYPFKASIDKNDNSEKNFILDINQYYQYSLPNTENKLFDFFGCLREYNTTLAYNLPRIADEIFGKNKYYSYSEFKRKIEKAIPNKKAYFNKLRLFLFYNGIRDIEDLLKYIREND